MNRVYYHRYPICPHCHEPAQPDDVGNLKKGGFQRCGKCQFEFRATLNLLDDKDIFKDFAEILKKRHQKLTDEKLRRLPLVWKVELNEIENTYVESLRDLVPGKYLVTWPWKSVKFSTVLISEYLLDNPHSRAIVVGRRADRVGEFREFGHSDIINNLMYLESRGDITEHNAVKFEVPKFGKNYLFKTRKVYHATIKLKGISAHPIGYRYYNIGPTGCKKEVLKKLEDEYGYREDQVRLLIINHNRKVFNPSDTAFIEINIERKEERGRALKLNYDRRHLTEVLWNIGRLRKVDFADRLTILAGPKDVGEVIEQISSWKPDLVLFEDFDSFFDRAYSIDAEKVVGKLISASGEASIILFSTHRNKRHMYGFGSKYGPWIGKYGIVMHTWDCDPVFQEMNGKYQRENITSNGGIPPMRKVNHLNVTKVEVRELEPISKMMEIVSRSISDEDSSDYVNYLRWLKRSLLYLKNSGGKLTYSYHARSGDEYSFDKFLDRCNDLYEYGVISEDETNEIRDTLKRIYSGNNMEPINPLRNRIIEWIKSLKGTADKSVVYLVAPPYEMEPLENVLKNSEVGSLIGNFLRISDWRRIAFDSRDASRDKKKYLIFSSVPRYTDLNEVDFDELVLVGCKSDLEVIGRAIEKGLTDSYSRPVYVPASNEKVPHNLKKIMENFALNTRELSIINEELSEPLQTEEVKSDDARSNYHLEPDEHALLLFDVSKNGILVPYNSSILIKGIRGIEEMEIGSSYSDRLAGELKGSLLFTTASGLFKSIFAELMIRKAGDITFTRSGFKWDGFMDLLKCSTSWNNLMANYIERGGEIRRREEELAVTLSKMDLSAKNPNYIKFWWQRYKEIGNGIRIYDIERPRGFKDMEKIILKMKELDPAAARDTCDPGMIYEASLHIQEIRRFLLKHDYYSPPGDLNGITGDIVDDMDEIIEKSSRLKVDGVADTVIVDVIHPFKVMAMAEIEKYCRICHSR
jgi:hypothetical protein